MAKKSAARKYRNLSGRKLTLEIRRLREEMHAGFTRLEGKLDRLIDRVDAFLKAHCALHGIKGHARADEALRGALGAR